MSGFVPSSKYIIYRRATPLSITAALSDPYWYLVNWPQLSTDRINVKNLEMLLAKCIMTTYKAELVQVNHTPIICQRNFIGKKVGNRKN